MYSERLISFLKEAEGSLEYQKAKRYYRDGFFHPYSSPEGGLPTVGYGHKFKENEEIKSITEEEATQLLINDIKEAENTAALYVNFSKLDDWRTDMALEFAFNLGHRIKVFRKFLKALYSNDFKQIAQHYKRYYRAPSGQVLEIKQRNVLFYDTFIKPKLEGIA